MSTSVFAAGWTMSSSFRIVAPSFEIVAFPYSNRVRQKAYGQHTCQLLDGCTLLDGRGARCELGRGHVPRLFGTTELTSALSRPRPGGSDKRHVYGTEL